MRPLLLTSSFSTSNFCHRFLGDFSEEDPPVPISNTVVKLLSPDGTARATVWESRKSPGLYPLNASGINRRRLCLVQPLHSDFLCPPLRGYAIVDTRLISFRE